MTDGLFARHSVEINREDVGIYSVLSYLALIRLDELTWPEFQRFVTAYPDIRMVTSILRIVLTCTGTVHNILVL